MVVVKLGERHFKVNELAYPMEISVAPDLNLGTEFGMMFPVLLVRAVPRAIVDMLIDVAANERFVESVGAVNSPVQTVIFVLMRYATVCRVLAHLACPGWAALRTCFDLAQGDASRSAVLTHQMAMAHQA